MIHLFNMDTLGGTRMQLRVKAPTPDDPYSVIHLHVPHSGLPPIARHASTEEAAFACIEYRERSAMHYTAPDWMDRYRALHVDLENEEEEEEEDDARLEARNAKALLYNAKKLDEDEGALREPSRGIFARLDEIQDEAHLRFRIHKLYMYKDDTTHGATALTTGCPLRIVLCLLFAHTIPDGADARSIGGTRMHSLRLDFRSV